jgi:biopolymer transport protein ExbB/TolQ
MFDSALLPLAHDLVRWLLVPTLAALLTLAALAVWELGLAIGERFGGLARLRRAGDARALMFYGRRRIERVDIIARIAPMLGLMGTLIPLGPGIAALSRGEFEILARAVSVAFDTTVIGLALGIAGYLIGRLRRRWYDRLLSELEGDDAPA